tara:strand:+ start:2617 stop:4017 length:1401 start_codon:yes stop_codon:yes gene_type:complete
MKEKNLNRREIITGLAGLASSIITPSLLACAEERNSPSNNPLKQCFPDYDGPGQSFPKYDGPNIVLMMADDAGVDAFPSYGGTSYKTPNLEALAKEGVKFSRCFSQPLCSPSRVQIMTGLYNNKVYSQFGLLPPQATTFGDILKKSGYDTAVVGKWQLAANGSSEKGTFPSEAGFDRHCLWKVDQEKEGNRYIHPRLRTDGVTKVHKDKFGPDVVCDYALDFIKDSVNSPSPFFLYYPMILPHSPFIKTPKDNGKEPNSKNYFENMVFYMDHIVGRVIRTLKDEILWDNTLFMFVSDNGTDQRITSMMGEESVKGGKRLMNDRGTHVPLIAHWKTEQGTVCEDLIDFTDFLPTFAELAQIPLDKSETDGFSFLPQLQGEEGNPRDWVFSYYDPRMRGEFAGKDRGEKPRWSARDKTHRLYDDGSFFHSEEDRSDANPLTEDELSPEELAKKRELQVILDKMTSLPI